MQNIYIFGAGSFSLEVLILANGLILHRLWQLKSRWDESILQELYTQWVEYRQNLQDMQILTIPPRYD